ELVELPLDAIRARRAGHAADRQLDAAAGAATGHRFRLRAHPALPLPFMSLVVVVTLRCACRLLCCAPQRRGLSSRQARTAVYPASSTAASTAASSISSWPVTTRRPVSALTSIFVTPGISPTSSRTDISQCPQVIPVTWYSLTAMIRPPVVYTPEGYPFGSRVYPLRVFRQEWRARLRGHRLVAGDRRPAQVGAGDLCDVISLATQRAGGDAVADAALA